MLVVQSCRSTRLSQHSLKRLRRWPRHVPASNSCSCLRQLGTVGTNISSRSSSVHFVAQRRNSDLAASSSDSSPRRDDDDATEQADVQSPNVVSWLRPLWNDAKSPMSNSRLEPSTVDRPLGMDASDIASPFSLEPFDIQDTELENAQLESNHEEQPDSSASVLLPDPKRTWPIDSALYPHVRACLSDIEFDDADLGSRDTGLSVCTLGTGAGNATRARCNTCTVVKNGSTSYLIDAGEGLQRQFLASRISFRDVRQIFISTF
jgi:hypothetical protein